MRSQFGVAAHHPICERRIRCFCVVVVAVVFQMSGLNNNPAQARELLEASPDAALSRIQDLEAQRLAMNADRKRIARELKNETQKRKRLMTKARALSTDDLLNVVVSRAAQAKAKAKAKAMM